MTDQYVIERISTLEKKVAAVESRLQQLPDEIRAICAEDDETLEKKILRMIYSPS